MGRYNYIINLVISNYEPACPNSFPKKCIICKWFDPFLVPSWRIGLYRPLPTLGGLAGETRGCFQGPRTLYR
jgi:hypothetical protein